MQYCSQCIYLSYHDSLRNHTCICTSTINLDAISIKCIKFRQINPSHHHSKAKVHPSHLTLTKTRSKYLVTILLISMRLKLILIPLRNRRRATNTLQLTLNIVMQMLVTVPVLRQCSAAIPAAEGSAAILVILDS